MPIHVALPLPRIEPLTYEVPEGINVRCGCRVLVPLGTRVLTGTVVALDQPPVEKMRPILEVLDEEPSFSEQMLELAKRISEYYVTSWGEVLHAALPTGLTPTTVVRVTVMSPVTEQDLHGMERNAPKRARLLRELQGHTGEISVSYLQRKLKASAIADQLDALQRMGWIHIETSIETQRAPRLVRAVKIADSLLSDEGALHNAFDLLDAKAPKQSLALGHIYLTSQRDGKAVPISRMADELHVSASVVDSLERRGFVEITSVIRSSRDEKLGSLVSRDESAIELTVEQQHAVDSINALCDAHQRRSVVLHGVTGSGKTVVYQRSISHVLEQGGQVLLLVPEISLTPQLADRFRAVFGDRVAVIHSKLAISERIGLWQRIRSGEFSIVIGARSAVFAPLENVRLIIVDEEHEPSYKQDDPAPRYHGRDVALMRGQIHQCPVVLGSATPSLESLANVAAGRAILLQLTHRADGALLPAVRVVDLRVERKAKRMKGALSFLAIDAIARVIERKEGTLVFLNRRGYAVNLQCEDCGDVPMCKNCDVALTYHKTSHVLRCHYCGYAEAMRMACTMCGSVDLKESGSGTQRIEEDLIAALTESMGTAPRVERMDSDTTSRKGEHRAMLERFARGDIDVLVGTQMIAKGLDIARVTLVVVVNADMSLHQNDFRASERTVQLLNQVAGRAGRTGAHPGEMIIQTSSPDHPAIVAAINGERSPDVLRAWEADELRLRREVDYPPYTRFVVIEISSLDEAAVEDHSKVFAALIPQRTDYLVRLDPVMPSVARIRNAYRRVIVIKNFKDKDPSGTLFRSLLRNAFSTYYSTYASSSVKVTLDIDAHGTI